MLSLVYISNDSMDGFEFRGKSLFVVSDLFFGPDILFNADL